MKKAAYSSPPTLVSEHPPRAPGPPAARKARIPKQVSPLKTMLNYTPMTNFDRILSEARELLTEAEQRRLSVELMPAAADDMDAEERAALDKAIEEGFEDFDKGDYSDARTFAKQLLARP